MEILISGGLGLIGSALAAGLQASGHNVHVVDSLDPRAGGNIDNLPVSLRERLTIACISDSSIWEQLPDSLDIVVNLAGLSGHNYSMTEPGEDLAINVVAQATFLRNLVSRGHKPHVILASTRQVYGIDPRGSAGQINPADVNAVAQYACEQLHEVLLRGTQARLSILRLSNVYGPSMLRASTPQGIIGTWLQSAAQGRQLRVTLPSPERDLLHVEDLCDLISLIIGRGAITDTGVALDVGGGTPISLDEVAQRIASLSECSVLHSELTTEEAIVAVQDYTTDLTRVSALYGWQPTRDWRLEISKIVQEARRAMAVVQP